jgi:hypothetical protein
VHARWNAAIIEALLDGTKKALAQAGVKDENIVIQSVPGSYELPYAVKQYVWTDGRTDQTGRMKLTHESDSTRHRRCSRRRQAS